MRFGFLIIMQRFEKILVIIDAQDKSSVALTRALSLANQNASSIHIAIHTFEPSTSYNPLLTEEDIEQIKEQECSMAKRWAMRILEGNCLPNVEVNSSIFWGKKSYMEIAKLCHKLLFDIVIMESKMVDGHRVLSLSDWYLICHCPPPLLLVHRNEWLPNKPILASLELGEYTREHDDLNSSILDQTHTLAQCLGSSLNISHAYPKPPAYIEMGHPNITPWDYRKQFKELIEERYEQITKPFTGVINAKYLIEGLPAAVISKIIKQIEPSITTIGLLAHLDKPQLIVGQIAEQLIVHLNCELFIIKPDNFFEVSYQHLSS